MFKRMYFMLFNRITDAITAMERGDTERARTILLRAQQDAEKVYIEASEESDGCR